MATPFARLFLPLLSGGHSWEVLIGQNSWNLSLIQLIQGFGSYSGWPLFRGFSIVLKYTQTLFFHIFTTKTYKNYIFKNLHTQPNQLYKKCCTTMNKIVYVNFCFRQRHILTVLIESQLTDHTLQLSVSNISTSICSKHAKYSLLISLP